ncbi:hypothetical protein FHT70_000548 [Rhizobium sp. BK049]|nr:hypothetical protein [Rhizobium sp. BK049]
MFPVADVWKATGWALGNLLPKPVKAKRLTENRIISGTIRASAR